MPQSPQCPSCRYCAHSPYLVCAINPQGPQTAPCPDHRFSLQATQRRQPAPFGWHSDDWRPAPPATYAGEAIEQSATPRTQEERWALLNWHPLFTGRCPNCEMPLRQTSPRQVHWDCQHCGWLDDSI
jgi:hypothetical protein